jgi:signal transduction histidine kinase
LYQTKNQELNKKEQNLKEIALSVAHELSTHFSAIKINAAQLKKNLLEPADIRSLERINYILKDASLYLEMLQSNFKDYLPKAKWDTFDVSSVLHQIIDDYPLDIDHKNLIKIFGESFYVKFDQRVFSIVFINLIKNALFFIEKAEKGEISITLQKGEKFNTIFFKDTSYGIRSDFVDQVFDRFFSRRNHGTGLGLYFCKTAMQNFRGDIICDSRIGEYTNFSLTFPKIS